MKRFAQTFIFLLFVSFPLSSWAATHYVSATGTDTWANSTDIAKPCAYTTANTNAAAGDTVIYLNDGGVYTITGNFIAPTNSGSSGSPIVFQAEAGATVEVRHTGAGAYLRNRSYITIDGFLMKRTGAGGWVDLRNKDTAYTSHHIIIQNCTFRDTSATQVWGGIWITGGNNNISILDNDINDTYGENMSPNDVIHVRPAGTAYTIEYIRVENNVMVGGAHSCLAFHNGNGGTLRYIVVKGNNIRNPNHRAMEVYSDDTYGPPSYVLLDNNVFWDSGSICSQLTCNENVYGSTTDKAMDRWQQPNLQWVAEYGIVRRNRLYNGGTGGPYTYVPTGNYSQHNRFYNNVIYKNGYGTWLNSNTQTDNIFVNNAFVDNDLTIPLTNKQIYFSSETSPCANEWRYNNFDGSEAITFNDCTSAALSTITAAEAAIPTKFHDNLQVASGFTSKTTYDFTLAVGSDLIDAGDWLTTAVGAGTESTTLVVADAKYFTYGWGMITGDTIQIEGRVATAVISNIIDNTILLATPLTWSNGEGVALAYSGTKPDIGAYEGASGDTTIPIISNPSPTVTQSCLTNPKDVVISLTCTDNIACVSCKADTTETDIDSMTLTMTQNGTTWSYTIVGLACDSTDDYQVECKDAALNESGPTTITVTIGPQEYEPPASVVGVTAGTGTIAGGGTGKIDAQ